jgi:hypothetical protein
MDNINKITPNESYLKIVIIPPIKSKSIVGTIIIGFLMYFIGAFLLDITSLYMKSRAWRSVRLEAAKPTNIFLSSKLTEPCANQQGKRVQIYQKTR